MISMKVKAKVSFSGLVSMAAGDTAVITDDVILQDLLQAGYVEAVKAATKEAPADESKRVRSKRSK